MQSWIHNPTTEPEKFINTFMLHASGDDPDISDIICERIRSHFRSGYCWHFASILQSVFNRGKICWAAPFSHFVWLDDDGIAYDIEGRYNGEAYQLIPAEYLGSIVECFKHISEKRDKETVPYDKDILIGVIKDYCKNKGMAYDSDVEEYYLNG